MDKRSIFIIIILIVGLSCMYLIVDTSNTVGNAITDVNKSTVTLPSGFSVKSTGVDNAVIHDKVNNETIKVTDLGKGNFALKSFEDQIKSMNENADISNISNSTSSANNLTLYTIKYDTVNGTKYISYVNTWNHTYSIKQIGYKNEDKVIEDLNFVSSTIQPDYKKAQD